MPLHGITGLIILVLAGCSGGLSRDLTSSKVATESVPPQEYQRCIEERKQGRDQAALKDCNLIWQQSHAAQPQAQQGEP